MRKAKKRPKLVWQKGRGCLSSQRSCSESFFKWEEMTRNPVFTSREGVFEMMRGKPETDMEWSWTRSCPAALEERCVQRCGSPPGRRRVCRGHRGRSVGHLAPRPGAARPSPPKMALLTAPPPPPSSALLGSAGAVWTQIKWQSRGLKKKENFFILEVKNVMSPVPVHSMSPEMASSLC